MKIKTISRAQEEMTRERPTDVLRVHKNIEPVHHPFEKAREYMRALNATKTEKILAKPFIGAFSGHSDGIYSMAKCAKSLTTLVSGACDGEIRVWSIPFRTTKWHTKAHTGIVRGLSISSNGESFLSCGDDKIIKSWKMEMDEMNEDNMLEEIEPLNTWVAKHSFTGIDIQRDSSVFATSGTGISIWDANRSTPLTTFEWGADTVTSVKFNPIETDLVASTATDRSIAIYDLRGNTPIRKLVMEMKSNSLSWNPMEAFNFTIANEDHNLYTFDTRKLDIALKVHTDHVSAVLDVDYSPTGQEFVSGSYDRTIRIFRANEPRSREVYHLKRMQRIFVVKFSADSKFVFSGSDDTNIRVWKANAAEPLGVLLPRQQTAINYSQKLKERYQHTAEIRRIYKHRHLPKAIYNAKKLKLIMKNSQQRKEENRMKHTKPEKRKIKPEKTKHIVAQLE